MSNHQKRLSVPKSWPVERKEATFTVKAGAGPHGESGVPLLILLRDVLGYVDSRKEARYALNQDSVLINGTAVSDEERPVGMFDIVAFMEREEFYRVFPDEGGRLTLTPIDEDAAGSKLGKIENKQHVPGGHTQLTLHDGQTLLVSDDAYNVGDSIVVGHEDSEASSDASDASGDEPRADGIVAHFEYEEGALVTAVAGAHAGEIGTIESIQVTSGSSPNNVVVSQDGSDGFETIEEYVVVIDENFTGDDGDEETDADSDEGTDADSDEETDADSDEETDADSDEETEAETDSNSTEGDE